MEVEEQAEDTTAQCDDRRATKDKLFFSKKFISLNFIDRKTDIQCNDFSSTEIFCTP